LARITGGGKLKVDHTPALAKAVAIVVRNVVSATGGIFHPTIAPGLRYGASAGSGRVKDASPAQSTPCPSEARWWAS
jgi:hypothetical protein